MTWAYVAVGAAVVVGSAMSTNSANEQASAQASAGNNTAYKNYTNSVRQTMENNRAIGEANTTNMIRAGYKIGILNLQTARLKEQAAQEGWNVSKKATEALGNAEANTAASGTVGASVNAVSNDIKKKSDEAQIAVSQNWYHTLENQNVALSQTVQAAQDMQQNTQSIPDISTVNTQTAYQQSVWGNAAGSLLGAYAGSQMNLGGSSGGATGSFSGGDFSGAFADTTTGYSGGGNQYGFTM